jgi:hypothetical protein
MKKLIGLPLATFLVSTATTVLAAPVPETQEFDSKDLNKVVIENKSGKVSVTASEGAKATVLITKHKFSEECKLTVEKDKTKLILKVKRGFFSSAECEVDFEVKVPKKVDVDTFVGSGNVDIQGVQGELEFWQGSGNYKADGEFRDVDGKAGSGSVDIKGLTGTGDLKMGSGNASLKFAKIPTSKTEFSMKVGSGDVDVLVPKGGKFKSSFKAGSGELTNEVGDTPDSPFTISMAAGSGNLKIHAY